ncbi:hypothetical protein AB1L30_17935 [Bremerella sp. JC817]|uniref:hypothetical protein n=1 Tax=Bremerella sp. JC817 TaxID=3231756 RepID=UPI0034588EAC
MSKSATIQVDVVTPYEAMPGDNNLPTFTFTQFALEGQTIEVSPASLIVSLESLRSQAKEQGRDLVPGDIIRVAVTDQGDNGRPQPPCVTHYRLAQHNHLHQVVACIAQLQPSLN